MPALSDENRCTRINIRGARCANRRLTGSAHCRFHNRPAPGILADLDGMLTDHPLDALDAVPVILTRTLRGVAEGRIPSDTARTITYICQMLMGSVSRAMKERGSVPGPMGGMDMFDSRSFLAAVQNLPPKRKPSPQREGEMS